MTMLNVAHDCLGMGRLISHGGCGRGIKNPRLATRVKKPIRHDGCQRGLRVNLRDFLADAKPNRKIVARHTNGDPFTVGGGEVAAVVAKATREKTAFYEKVAVFQV